MICSGIQTSIDKEPYKFVIFQGGCLSPPLPGSAHAMFKFLFVCLFVSWFLFFMLPWVAQDKHFFERKAIGNIFLPISFNIYLGNVTYVLVEK